MHPAHRGAFVKELKGRVALITGASRGLGVYIARELAKQGMDLVLAARSAELLEKTRAEVAGMGVRAIAIPTDVADRDSLGALVRRAEAELGAIDVLVNNAGIEDVSAYELLGIDQIEQCITVNLTAPMVLTRLVLPGMLARKRGHIVNISSLAGMGANAYEEVYSATKHGLVGFTRSLRATADAAGTKDVGYSVICPGFVSGSGMFEDMRKEYGVEAPAILGVSPPEAVARAVVQAIRYDVPDIMVNPGPTRPLLALVVLAPRLAEWLSRILGVHQPFRQISDAQGKGRTS